MCSGPAFNQLDKLLLIGPRAGVIYSRLFKYTQQHIAGFTEEQLGPEPHKADPIYCVYCILFLGRALHCIRSQQPALFKDVEPSMVGGVVLFLYPGDSLEEIQ